MNNCPKCGETALAGAEGPGGVAVDQCPGCRGVWLDAGELEAVLGAGGGAATDLALIAPGLSDLKCPRCGDKMRRGGLVNPLLLADKCSACGGFWLDGGELPRLKELTDTAAPAAPGRRRAMPPGSGMGAQGLQAGFTRSAMPEDEFTSLLQGKVFPFAAALFGFGGCIYQVFKYIDSVEKVPFQTAPGLAGLAQSLGWFFAVTVGCIALFLFGLYMLLRDVSNISGDK
ncbi:MAG: zf-TFIIB domain-containing protein [Elusimicrobiales bacterium]|nr:zf-TFIIB domain-containing protein [Elusimicrobiales bacterium]